MLKRNYLQRTLKILFAQSGNQCAHPQCTNTVIEPATEFSDAAVKAQIAHIYALNTDGPRGKVGLTQEELNSHENLILLCATHHQVVDKQYETYPAETLQQWKQRHEAKMKERLSADRESVEPDVFDHRRFPKALVDGEIEDNIQNLRKTRFFQEFDKVRLPLELGRRIVEGDLSGGTDKVRCRALAWIARLLSRTDEIATAEQYISLAKELGACPEIKIADAFVASQRGDKTAALRALPDIDSPCLRSAAFSVMFHHEGARGALDWLNDAGINPVDMDSEGKFFLLACQLELARWNIARETLNTLTDQDFEQSPVLHRVKAITLLLTTVPDEFRSVVLSHLPFEAATFPLASNQTALSTRREAQRHFTEAAVAARELNCLKAAIVDDEYALWLELRDPEHSDNGRKRLQEKLEDAKSALRAVPLALKFGIDLDITAIEQQITQQIALNGGATIDTAFARFALACKQQSAEDVANYVARHYDELSKFLDQKVLRSLQVEVLSQAGFPDRANEFLELLLQDGLSEVEEGRLRGIISEAEGVDSVEARESQFKESNSLDDLARLVSELERRQDWDRLCQYGILLFEWTRDVRVAKQLAQALINAHKSDQLVKLVNENPGLLSQSEHLHMAYCLALYNEGELLEANQELANLGDNSENPNYRALRTNLAIALGDWDFLYSFVENEYSHRETRNAQDLIRMAQLALHIGSPHAKNLTFAAVEKAGDNAAVLANAYFLASSSDWENDAEVSGWLNKAAELSGDDGPFQRMSLKEILDQKPKWDQQESEIWRLFSHGEIPMFFTAQSLHKSLIHLTFFPALANLSANDPRYKSAIPAYSGNCQSTQFDLVDAVAGMDTTALLTLSFLDILDQAFDVFKTVWVPHSTLIWLFEEKQRAVFHQPSRIKNAHQIRHFLATDVLEKFVPSTVADSDLAAQVGDELALFIAEAGKARDDDTQRLVVRPSPVYRLSSLMEEEADLTGHAHVLCSCLSVVEMLRQKGRVTTEEETRARDYLNLCETPWPGQPVIKDGAILYLDELAIAYFLHLGILGKLKSAGFRPIVSPREIANTNALIDYERISDNVMDAVERIRSTVNSRIRSGAIKVGSQHYIEELKTQSASLHANIGVYALANNCDVIISDDRYFNQRQHVEDSSGRTPICSTLDLVDTLAATGKIPNDQRLDLRTQLRRAGYFFVSVTDNELAQHLIASEVRENRVIETAELKAIRENMLQARMGDYLQLPREAPWLHTTLKTFIRVLRDLWKENDDLSNAAVRSNWLVDQIDIGGWAHRYGLEQGENIVRTGRGIYILLLLAPLEGATEQARDNYWNWLEERVLVPLKEESPEMYARIIEWERSQIIELSNMEPPIKQEST